MTTKESKYNTPKCNATRAICAIWARATVRTSGSNAWYYLYPIFAEARTKALQEREYVRNS